MITYTEFITEVERELGERPRGRQIARWYKLWRAKYYTEPKPPANTIHSPITDLQKWLHSGGGSSPTTSRISAASVRKDPPLGAFSPEMKANLKRAYTAGCRVSILRLVRWMRDVHGVSVPEAAALLDTGRVEEVL